MRIFLLSYSFEENVKLFSGGLRKIIELTRHLKKAGHGATIFLPDTKASKEKTTVPHVYFPVIDQKILRPLSAYASQFVTAFKVAHRTKPDVIYFRISPTILPVFLAWIFRAKLVFEINGDTASEMRGRKAGLLRDNMHFLRMKLTLLAEKINVRAADLVIVLTEGLRDIVVSRHGVPAQKIIILGSGTNTAHCRPMNKECCRRQLGLQADSKIVAFIGVLYSHQGLETLIAAAPAVIKRFPEAVFLIGGNGPDMKNLIEMVTADNLSSAFTFAGEVPYAQLPAFLNSADICVAPFKGNRGEASPLKLFDYLACGKPVVCSAIPSIAKFCKKNQAVISVRPDNPQALAQAINTILANPQQMATMGAAGRQSVEKGNSWDAITQKIISRLE